MSVLRYVCCLLVMGFALSSCGKVNEALDRALAQLESEEGNEGNGVDVGPGGPNPEFQRRERRGSWNLRLWVGLWCDRNGLRRTRSGEFVFIVDGVEMYRMDADCSSPSDVAHTPPNGGSFAFTLEQGAHSFQVVTPDSETVDYALTMAADQWLVVNHRPELDAEGADRVALTTFRSMRDAPNYDADYEVETAPNEETMRGRTDLTNAHVLPAGALARADEVENEEDGDRSDRGDEGESPGGAAGDASDAPRARTPRNMERRAAPDPEASAWSDAAMGSLTVLSREPADVFIDGRATGHSAPLDSFSLREGRYRVELRNASGETIRAFSVNIEPGRNHRLVH